MPKFNRDWYWRNQLLWMTARRQDFEEKNVHPFKILKEKTGQKLWGTALPPSMTLRPQWGFEDGLSRKQWPMWPIVGPIWMRKFSRDWYWRNQLLWMTARHQDFEEKNVHPFKILKEKMGPKIWGMVLPQTLTLRPQWSSKVDQVENSDECGWL